MAWSPMWGSSLAYANCGNFVVKNLKYIDKNGNSSYNVENSSTLSTIQVYKYVNSSTAGKIVVALYNEANVLTQLKIIDISASMTYNTTSTINVNMSLPANADKCSIKVFTMSDYSTLKPLALPLISK